MATGVSGYFDLTGDNGAMARVHYAEYYDAIANQSTLEIGLQIASSWYSGVTYYLDGGISAGGHAVVAFTSFAGSNSATLPALNTYVTVGGSPWTSGAISHNTDGTGAVEISISIHGYTKSGGAGSGWAISGSKTVTLTAIPRSSTIGATDANIGAVSMIAIGKKHASYTHSIQYHFGDLSGYITADGGVSTTEVRLSDTSIPWVVPESFYSQIPNAKTGVCTLVCWTYVTDTTWLSEYKTTQITVTAAEAACRPEVSGTVVDINADTIVLTGDAGTLVRYRSTAMATITAAAKNGASIVSRMIGGVAVDDGDSRDIPNVDTDSLTFAASDSRGYTNAVSVANPVIPYIILTNNASVARTDPTSGNAVLTLSGDCYTGSFGAVANAVSATYKIGTGVAVPIDLTVSNGTYTATVQISGLDYQTKHKITVTVYDKLDAVSKSVTVLPGIPVFDWGEKDFAFNVPVTVCGVPVGLLIGSTDNPGCYYRMIDGEQEWVNPPLKAGVSYRTDQRWLGNVVYTRLVDCGTFADNKKVSVDLGGPVQPIRATVQAGNYLLPAYDLGSAASGNVGTYWICRTTTGFYVWLYGGSSFKGLRTYAQVWYTVG